MYSFLTKRCHPFTPEVRSKFIESSTLNVKQYTYTVNWIVGISVNTSRNTREMLAHKTQTIVL